MKTFQEWLKIKETSTSTGSIAGFSRPVIPSIKRGSLGEEDPFFKKNKKKKKKKS